MEKKYKKRDRFENFVRFSKLLTPICAGLFYVCCFIALLLGLVALIVVFVNVPTEDMLLPPFMHTVTGDDGTIEGKAVRIDYKGGNHTNLPGIVEHSGRNTNLER